MNVNWSPGFRPLQYRARYDYQPRSQVRVRSHPPTHYMLVRDVTENNTITKGATPLGRHDMDTVSVLLGICAENHGLPIPITKAQQRRVRMVSAGFNTIKRLNAHVLQWRHNGRDSVSNHQPKDCLLNRLFRRRSKKTSRLRVTGLCAGNSAVTGEFPAQMASNAENVSIWWRHHVSWPLCLWLYRNPSHLWGLSEWEKYKQRRHWFKTWHTCKAKYHFIAYMYRGDCWNDWT